MRFGPDRRVRKRHEFQTIQSQGKRVVGPHFVFVIARASQEDQLPRLGITVTKRVGNSVRRSRIKRILRAAFQKGEGWLPPGFDLVVICRRDHPELKSASVILEWEKSSKKVRRALDALLESKDSKSSSPSPHLPPLSS